jgi:hypothetical protein
LIHAIAHLSPNDLAAVSLVSRRFNDLVTTPHAWQVAFGRYFPGEYGRCCAVREEEVREAYCIGIMEKRVHPSHPTVEVHG